jgi:hypothetical protein
MTEATWGESAKTPEINWRMSASLETSRAAIATWPKSPTSNGQFAIGRNWTPSIKPRPS